MVKSVAARSLDERKLTQPPARFDEQELFVFGIETCLFTTTAGHGDPGPNHTAWRAPT